MAEPGEYLSLQDAAKTYEVSTDTLYRLMSAGRLTKFRRLGRRRTWLKRSELDEVFEPKRAEE